MTGSPPPKPPIGCLPIVALPWILWLGWVLLAPWMLLADDTQPWLWIVWLIPIIVVLIPIPKPMPQGVLAEGPEQDSPPTPPWWAGCWSWPVVAVLLLVVATVVIVLLAGNGDDGESIESATPTTETRNGEPETTEVRVDETTTTVAPGVVEDGDEIVASSTPTTDASVIESTPATAPASTTTTAAPETTVPDLSLPPDAQALVSAACAVDSAGAELTELTFQDGAADITSGPAAGSTPPPASNAPAGLEIDYVGTATATCPVRAVMLSVRLIAVVQDVQVALALDFPEDIAGDSGYVADPAATDPIGMTGGWDQLFPFSGGELLQFDDQFATIDVGATVSAEEDLVTFVVPVAEDVEMVGYTVQTFFRDGSTASDPIAWNAATGSIDLAMLEGE